MLCHDAFYNKLVVIESKSSFEEEINVDFSFVATLKNDGK